MNRGDAKGAKDIMMLSLDGERKVASMRVSGFQS